MVQLGEADGAARAGEIGRRRERGYTAILVVVIVLCGLVVAGLFTALSALAVVAVDGAPMEILMVSGGTFGACLTLEIALAGLYAGLRR